MFLSFASWRRFWGLALVVLAASACQADFAVLVTVNPDGSGQVSTRTRLDNETTAGLLDLDVVSTGLLLDDLAQSGWVIVPPEQEVGGSTVITATKDFGTTEQFGAVMDELTGPDGVFTDFKLERSKTFARVTYELTGELDTTEGIDAFGDQELEALLGQDLTDIVEDYDGSDDQVSFRVEVDLPGGLQGDAPNGIVDAEPNRVRAVWSASLADNEATPVALGSSARDVTPLVLRGIAGLAAVLAALAVFAAILRVALPDRGRRSQRRSKPKPKPKPKSDPAARQPSSTPSVIEPDSEPDGHLVPATAVENPHRVLAVDAMGVLFREADEVTALLIPFVHEHSSVVPTDEEVEAKARALSLGRITTSQFWTSVGVAGEPSELDAAYLARYQLMPGVIKYLRSQRTNGMQVACITNCAASWAQALRANHDLQGLIDPWIVSGSVGVCKPDKPIFEVLRRRTGQPPAKILVLDDDLAMLDAAREQGFATAWFAPDGSQEQAGEHQLIRSFEHAIGDHPDAQTALGIEPATKSTD